VGGDGCSWATAFDDLQVAIDQAPVDAQIWVAAGTYWPPQSLTPTGFTISKSLEIYGAFEGNETSLQQRGCPTQGSNITTIRDNPTQAQPHLFDIGASAGSLNVRLDGLLMRDGGQQVGVITLADGGAIRIQNNGATPNVVIAWCDLFSNRGSRGGGIAAIGPGTTTIKWTTITGCIVPVGQPGGGVFADQMTLNVFNSVVSQNIADRGSAISLENSATATIANCLMTQNQVDTDGVVHLQQSSASVLNCTIWANAVPAEQVTLYTDSRGCSLTIANSIVSAGVSTATNAPIACVSYSNIEGGGGNGVGNIDDPMQPSDFFDINENDFQPLQGSIVNDAGNSDMAPADLADVDEDGDTLESVPLDLSNRLRFQDDFQAADTGQGQYPIVEMGAFEYQQLVGDPPQTPCQNLEF